MRLNIIVKFLFSYFFLFFDFLSYVFSSFIYLEKFNFLRLESIFLLNKMRTRSSKDKDELELKEEIIERPKNGRKSIKKGVVEKEPKSNGQIAIKPEINESPPVEEPKSTKKRKRPPVVTVKNELESPKSDEFQLPVSLDLEIFHQIRKMKKDTSKEDDDEIPWSERMEVSASNSTSTMSSLATGDSGVCDSTQVDEDEENESAENGSTERVIEEAIEVEEEIEPKASF